MKSRAATLLSVMGVLVAGSAAAMVNAQVLQPSAAPTVSAPMISNPGSTVSASTVAQPLAPPPATQATYQIATAGQVTVDTSGDVLNVVGVTPYTDWTVVGVTNTFGRVDVVLQQGTTLVQFSASLVEGVVSTGVVVSQVASESPEVDDPRPGTTVSHRPGGATTTTSVGHDDDEDEDDDD